MEIELIGKKINYIKLHDFLERIDVEHIYSSLHAFYNTLISKLDSSGKVEWAGHEFTRETLTAALKEEEGVLESIRMERHASKLIEVSMKFTSGNEMVTKVKVQEQIAQILQFLFDYK